MKVLSGAGHSLHVLSRHAGTNLPPEVGLLSVWNPANGPPPRESLERTDVMIHLAGEPVAQRWTANAREQIRQSRVSGTRHLVEALSALPRKPAALVCASAIGYYGSRGEELLNESAPPGSGFLPEVCVAWEREARAAEALGMRVACIRIGIALDTRGGALPQMINPFRFGVGGRLGSGQQWMSWIHLDDLAELFRFAAEQPVSGAVNGVAPKPVRNVEFTKEIARALKRPALFRVPGFALQLLLGDMAELLLASQRCVPASAQAAGFTFRYPQLGPALADLLR